MDENATLAVVVARLEDLRKDFSELREELRRSHEDKVSRREWIQRNDNVDQKFMAQGREISEIKQDIASRKAPWWAFAAVVVAGLALAWSVIREFLTM